ncbi:phosphoenolpyruvate--protein phosphotransferase [Futiania mangrovi]|uniref:phosphoenolpyruvate--protein phosphotransferase n=1 Tax=Futiania mangrovi TaxID=2959716 RepID=A0A9J6PC68_9PROT|nr:phosphoenolpyruvate--protein phosphotransferase [Futiania mangrovii]MCP1336137.1 phosphoenolpyruvate--protein phosphotransferase [Futiania mangrovii]
MPERGATGPRVLLRRLREVMAQPASAQVRLDRIVKIIAADMVAEVCSIYLKRQPQVLELFATEGLNPDAVHKTTMRVGEGLIGDIAANAAALNLADAQASPKFAYKPETGEDPYQSLMGVPILRDGRVLGVLAVQNQTRRHYTDEEVEALETVAMVVAEMVTGDLIDPASLSGEEGRIGPRLVKGLALCDGVAIGTAVLHEPRVEVHSLIAEDPEAERMRLLRAVDELRASLEELFARAELGAMKGEHREILETYLMFAEDKGWLRRMTEAVEQGLTAEAAAERVHNETRARMLRQTDPYLRERLHDLDDLTNRLLRKLVGEETAAVYALPDDAVVIARAMGPAELLDYPRDKLAGVVLEDGSPTAHVTILARALDIPMVGRVGEMADLLRTGDPVIVDGEAGEIHLRPAPDVLEAFRAKTKLRAQRRAAFARARTLPPVTRDGVRIALNMNAGLPFDLPHLAETNADGIGLFRTELQYMIGSEMPRLNAQSAFYREVLDTAGDKPVVFRTLDLGGDKLLPYGRQLHEDNPALGWRAIRMALDRPALLRYQIRALLEAAGGRALWLMFPMVADVTEFDAARALVDHELGRLDRFGKPRPADLKVGAMLEVPSLAMRIRAMAGRADFISVGSNDLLQFYFAADRGNPRLAGRYERLSPAALGLLRHIVTEAEAAGIPVSLCGEMAGRPLEAMALVALGFRALSMPAAAIGPVKLMVRSLTIATAERFILDRLTSPAATIRRELEEFAFHEGVIV